MTPPSDWLNFDNHRDLSMKMAAQDSQYQYSLNSLLEMAAEGEASPAEACWRRRRRVATAGRPWRTVPVVPEDHHPWSERIMCDPNTVMPVVAAISGHRHRVPA